MASKNFDSMLDTIGNMTVIELADFIKSIEEKFGVSAAMPMMAAAPAAGEAEAPKEEKTQFKVTLKSVGDKKIDVIKALRKVVPSLGLTEAKNIVENAPSVIAEAASKDDSQKMKQELEAVGAKIEIA